MKFASQHLDWTEFWVVEVVLLAVPSLFTVMVLRGQSNLSARGAGMLAVVLIALSAANWIVALHRGALHGRSEGR